MCADGLHGLPNGQSHPLYEMMFIAVHQNNSETQKSSWVGLGDALLYLVRGTFDLNRV